MPATVPTKRDVERTPPPARALHMLSLKRQNIRFPKLSWIREFIGKRSPCLRYITRAVKRRSLFERRKSARPSWTAPTFGLTGPVTGMGYILRVGPISGVMRRSPLPLQGGLLSVVSDFDVKWYSLMESDLHSSCKGH